MKIAVFILLIGCLVIDYQPNISTNGYIEKHEELMNIYDEKIRIMEELNRLKRIQILNLEGKLKSA